MVAPKRKRELLQNAVAAKSKSPKVANGRSAQSTPNGVPLRRKSTPPEIRRTVVASPGVAVRGHRRQHSAMTKSVVQRNKEAALLYPAPKRQRDMLSIFTFGSGSMGELGLGPGAAAKTVKRPRLNPFLPPKEVGVVDISVGGMHAAALTCDGKIYTWGVNDQGALGRDTSWEAPSKDISNTDANEDEDVDSDDDGGLNPRESKPGVVEGLPENAEVVSTACGDSVTCALTSDGRVYAWGTFRV